MTTTMRAGLLGLLVVVATTTAWPAHADVVDEAFARGNAAAARGDLAAAAQAYEEAEQLLPGRSALLSYNLGTVCAQRGDLGRATLHLRRSLQAEAGATEDIAAAALRNLGIVRQRREVAAATHKALVDQPETWRDALITAVRSPGFGWLAVITGWLAAGLWLLRSRLAARVPQGVVGSIIGVLAAVFVIVGSLHGYAVRAESASPLAITLQDPLEVREGPGTHRKVLFTVQSGSRVRIVDRANTWLRIHLSSGPANTNGWVPEASVGELRATTPGSLQD